MNGKTLRCGRVRNRFLDVGHVTHAIMPFHIGSACRLFWRCGFAIQMPDAFLSNVCVSCSQKEWYVDEAVIGMMDLWLLGQLSSASSNVELLSSAWRRSSRIHAPHKLTVTHNCSQTLSVELDVRVLSNSARFRGFVHLFACSSLSPAAAQM